MATDFLRKIGILPDPIAQACQILETTDDENMAMVAMDLIKDSTDARLIKPLIKAAGCHRMGWYGRSRVIFALSRFPEQPVIDSLRTIGRQVATGSIRLGEDDGNTLVAVIRSLCNMRTHPALLASISVLFANGTSLSNSQRFLKEALQLITACEAKLAQSMTVDQLFHLKFVQDFTHEERYHPRTDDDMVADEIVTHWHFSVMEIRNIAQNELSRRGVRSFNPFIFRNGQKAATATQLIDICRVYTEDAAFHLFGGHFEPWLQYIQRPDLAEIARQYAPWGDNPQAGLEGFIQRMSEAL